MATSSRESRRRKILERGSDRLAFITGNLQNLPPPPPSGPLAQDPPPDFPSQTAVSPDVCDEASTSVLLKHNPSFDANQSQPSVYNGGIGEESTPNGRDRSIGTSNDTVLDTSGQANSLPGSSDDQIPLISTPGTAQHSETPTRKHEFFTPKQISSAIDASGQSRLISSVVVAVLVVLVHLGFPLLGNRFLGSMISIRPLYFILLTNITLVIGRLLYGDHVSSRRDIAEENKPSSADDNSWAEQLSKTLEVGLVAKKAIDAVFMDCSVYLIIVICGLSFT
ncbi:GET1-interacting protein [Hibiscus trionum]|uniref:GET1-interacting protein n=1 Tax=Hibiscus trionum TaxID=183268 RepID=A0A9W7M4C3_HIBTR|nr:GET1-interacting protein [Hibiscus trionum]